MPFASRAKITRWGAIVAAMGLYAIPASTRPGFTGTSAAEGVAVDAQGNIYGAEVGPKRVMKYSKRTGT